VTGRGSTFVEHFFDVGMARAQRWSNKFHHGVQCFQTGFVEETYRDIGPNRYFDAFLCFANVFDER
jgi:hypothetical protein